MASTAMFLIFTPPPHVPFLAIDQQLGSSAVLAAFLRLSSAGSVVLRSLTADEPNGAAIDDSSDVCARAVEMAVTTEGKAARRSLARGGGAAAM